MSLRSKMGSQRPYRVTKGLAIAVQPQKQDLTPDVAMGKGGPRCFPYRGPDPGPSRSTAPEAGPTQPDGHPGPTHPLVDRWADLAVIRWGPAANEPTPGIINDGFASARFLAAVDQLDPYAVQEREAIRSEPPGDPDRVAALVAISQSVRVFSTQATG
jgi:hypothetical protein